MLNIYMLGFKETNNIWKLGENNYTNVIKRGSVRIFPHLVYDSLMSYDDMFLFANELVLLLINKNIDCIINEKNTYTFELNGNWNVILTVKNKDNYLGMYTIIHCPYYKKTYFCPFYNIEYISLNHHALNSELFLEEFKILTNIIKNKLSVRSINLFPCVINC